MNRQFRRRVERQWNKIKVGNSCSKFLEHNELLTVPYVIVFQAVKLSEDLMCVYSLGFFDFKSDFGYVERATICQFFCSLFRNLGNIELGFVSEEDLEKGEEIQI